MIAVSETWLTTDKDLIYSLDGYKFVNKPCEGKAGGVGIFIQSNINFRKIENFELNLIKCDDLWLELTLFKNKKLLVGNIYRNPGYDFKNFQTSFSNTINKLMNMKTPFVVGGDLNIDILKKTHKNMDFIHQMEILGVRQTVNSPTRITWKYKNTILDHIYTNITQDEIITKTLSFEISDHLPNLALVKSFKFQPKKHDKIWVRSNKNLDIEIFNQDLLSKLNALPLNNLTANEAWNKFSCTFNSVLDKHAPLRLLSRKEKRLNQNPWLTKELQQELKYKHKWYRKLLKKTNKNPMSWAEFKKFRNKLTRKIEVAKRIYYKNKITISNSNPKKLWKTINNIIKINKRSNAEEVILTDNEGNQIKNKTKICNIFNKYFTSIGITLSNDIPLVSSEHTRSFNTKINPQSFYLSHITERETFQLIKNLNPTKTTRSDCPQIKYITMSAPAIAPTLTKIINMCIEENIFPDDLKNAEIIPIFKQGDKSKPTNWRPISILNPFSKIFERHIYNKLINFIDKHKILHKYQYGFRQNYSTENAVGQIHELLANNLEKNHITCSIFIDLRKAFDTVDHSILMTKLYNYGIRGEPLKLIYSYLTNRTQTTVVNQTQSSPENILCGVPQGSILGPLFFLLYINDLVNCSNFNVTLFADDACLMQSNRDLVMLEKIVNTELEKINTWAKINKLTINYEKTFYMLFSKRNITTNIKLSMNKTTLTRVSEFKYLGIVLHEKLNWTSHVNYIKTKVSKAYFILTKIRYYVDTKTLMLLYNSLIATHFNYCIITWGGAPESILKPLITLQKKISRIITFSDYTAHSFPLFYQLRMLRLQDIYKLKLAITFHKFNNDAKLERPDNVTKLNQIHKYNTRLSISNNFYTSLRQTTVGQATYTSNGIRIWRSVPNDFKNLPINAFKNKLKNNYIDQYNDKKLT